MESRRIDYDRRRIYEVYERTGFLAEGGVTAELLRLELQHATAYLAPFLKWTEITDRRPDRLALDTFLAAYDPDLPMHEQLRQLPTAGPSIGSDRPSKKALEPAQRA